MENDSDVEFRAFVGIDWADTKHDICVQAAGSKQRELSCIPHQVERIEEWACALRDRYGGPIAVALELSKGPIIYALQKYDFLTLFPINPTTLAKYREAIHPSGAKDDPSDAQIALELLVDHRDKLKALKPQSVGMRHLLFLVEERRILVNDKVRFTNRLGNALKQYFPQAIEWFDRRDTILFCDFISRWPTLAQVKRARTATLERFFHDHNLRFPKVVEARIEGIRKAVPLTEDPAVIAAHQLQVQVVAEQLRATLLAIDRFDHEIAAVAPKLEDYKLFSALPGAGEHLTPRLIVAFGEQRERFNSADELQRYAGVAPVTVRSGKKNWVHWRWACPTFLRQTIVEWSAQTINKSFWAGAYYRQQRGRGSSHQMAVRALAYKWIRILFRCWQSRIPYNETTYLNALLRRGSPLLNSASSAAASP